MKIRIGLAGDLPQDSSIFSELDLLVGQITGYLCQDGTEAGVEMLVSPSYTGKAWMEWNKNHSFSVCTYNMRGSLEYIEQCDRTVSKDTPLRNLIGEELCNRADVLLVVWSEDVTELSGATWELLRMAYEGQVPCIWFSTKSRQTYCLFESYYKKYSSVYLNEMLEPLYGEEMQPTELDNRKDRWFLFWERRRSNYLKKYKADNAVHANEEDYLLKQDFKMEADITGGEAVRDILIHKFEQFDSAAIVLNSRFQTMIYQRSVLPFIATIFLAVGFYAESVIGKPLSAALPDFTIIGTILSLIAGIGFLIHAGFNLYVYRLSKSRRVDAWRKDFANDRYVAEILRVLIHFLPYGVEVNLRKLCGKNQKLYTMIKHLTDDAEPVKQNVDRRTVSYVLQHMKEMLADQIAYHEASIKRYKAIVDSLEKWWRRIFYIGFWMVVGRGVLQFVLVILSIYGIKSDTPVSSFLNMLALLLPAWAGYFLTKAQQNNFRYNLNNHERMLQRLQIIQERVVNSIEQEEIPMEVLNIMIEELAELMLVDDTSEWQQQYMSSTIKLL